MPEELQMEFIDSFWHSLDWQNTPWLGHRVEKCPTDLIAYQDLVVRLRPDWIVETGTGSGGRALFLASVCDLIGHGRVLSVDATVDDGRPEHPRITYVHGDPPAAETIEQVADIIGSDPNALVFLGRDSRARLHDAFQGRCGRRTGRDRTRRSRP